MSHNFVKHHKHDGSCDCKPTNIELTQSLNEMDFERGIWNAAVSNEIDRIKEFINKGNTNDRDNSGYTALHYAARNGHKEICELLITAHADLNAITNGGATALHRAAMMGHTNIVKMLLQSKASPDIQDQDGQTPLHRSAAKGYLNVSKELLENCTNLKYIKDKKCCTPYDLVPKNNTDLKDLLAIDEPN